MTDAYEVVLLTEEERSRLQRIYEELLLLAECRVPSVRAAARASLAHIAQALNGEGIAFELYTARLGDGT